MGPLHILSIKIIRKNDQKLLKNNKELQKVKMTASSLFIRESQNLNIQFFSVFQFDLYSVFLVT